jgi:hypothetical protein
MIIQLVIATILVVAAVLIHGAGITALARTLALHPSGVESHHFSLARAILVLGLVLALFVLHGAEIWMFAAAYLGLGALQGLEQAVYFSTITYAAIGYSDQYIDSGWRLVAAIEGVCGIILLGWSTAFLVSVVARLRR